MHRSPTSISVLALAVLPFSSGCFMGIGKSGADLELGVPTMDVALVLDRSSYGMGAPIVAEVTVTNTGDKTVSVPRPGRDTIDFYLRPVSATDPRHTQKVAWALEEPEFVSLEPGTSDQRKFALNLATKEAGEYVIHAVYRTEPDPSLELAAATVTSPGVPITVDASFVVFERDGMGLITESEAKRVATEFFHRDALRAEARLVKDERIRMHIWWVTVYYASPADDGSVFGSCLIDPFLGHVRSKATKPVPPPTATPPGAPAGAPGAPAGAPASVPGQPISQAAADPRDRRTAK